LKNISGSASFLNELPMHWQFRVVSLIVQEAQFGVKTGFFEVHIGYPSWRVLSLKKKKV